MKKGIVATLAAGSLTVLLSTAANANGRECDNLSPCNGPTQNQGQGQHQGQGQFQGQGQGQHQGQGQNQNATGIGVGTGIGIGQGGNANANSNSNAVTSTQVRNTIESTYINPATPGTIYGQVNGQCMATRGVSIGAYLGSISAQRSEFNMQCMAWNTGLALLNQGINLHDPVMQAVAIETFREMSIDIDNAVISVLMAAQGYQLRGQPMPMSAWGLVEMDGKHGQEQRSAPRTLNFD